MSNTKEENVGWVSDSVTQQILNDFDTNNILEDIHPITWIKVTIGQIANVQSGVGFPISYQGKSEEIYPVYKVGDISRSILNAKGILAVAENTVSETDAAKLKGAIFPIGTTLFAKIGEAVRLNRRAYVVKPGLADNNVMGVKPFFQEMDKFIYFFMKTVDLNEASRSTTVPSIRKSDIEDLSLYLPPLSEQHQIAAKLDELLAQVDSIKTRLDAIPSILKRFRQSVLAAAVSGKLTEDWRQSADHFDVTSQIEAILTDRQTISGNKKKPVNHLINEEYEIPFGWEWVSLDALSAKIVDGTHHTPTYVEKGVPFISVKDIKKGNIDFSDTKFITKEEHEELCKRCNPEIGDLLITKSGTIGRTAIVNTENEFSLFVSVALIKPASKKCNMHFINLALKKWVNEIDVSSRIVGSAIKNLHLVDMRVLAIPFPSIQEQSEIVHRVEQIFAYADQTEQRVKDAQARVNHLTQAILAKAFRGELTADWRAQNPDLISGENSAEALLAKIQTERSHVNTGKSSQRRRSV